MAMKITIADLPDARRVGRSRSGRLVGRKVRQEDGSHAVHYRLDATDSAVGDDVLVLFKRNAARARRRRREHIKKHNIAAE